jgi:hypothetical protein
MGVLSMKNLRERLVCIAWEEDIRKTLKAHMGMHRGCAWSEWYNPQQSPPPCALLALVSLTAQHDIVRSVSRELPNGNSDRNLVRPLLKIHLRD